MEPNAKSFGVESVGTNLNNAFVSRETPVATLPSTCGICEEGTLHYARVRGRYVVVAWVDLMMQDDKD